MKHDVLSFIDARRSGGGGKSGRSYLDCTINQRPLRALIQVGDLISVFGWLDSAHEGRFARQLLTREGSELASQRVPIYVCAECADLGCGAVTVRVTKHDDCYVWSEFGYENNYETEWVETDPHVRDFCFRNREYEAALSRFTS